MKNIISVSRRTDIPAFYTEWFMRRLDAGEVYVRNAYNGRFSKVSLLAEDIYCFVFWSKNYAPLIPYLDKIEKVTKNLFFHFTITGIPKGIEFNSPFYAETIKDFLYLSQRYAPEHLIWRFDPICITDKMPFEFYEERFAECAELMKGHCVSCYISFVNKYKKVFANFERYTNNSLVDVPQHILRQYAHKLSRIATRYGIKLFACCNDFLVSDKVHKGSCIDAHYLAHLFKNSDIVTIVAPTRRECACTKSIDIGAYDTCPHGCVYCYANADIEKAKASYLKQQVDWNALGTNIDYASEVKNKTMEQRDLF